MSYDEEEDTWTFANGQKLVFRYEVEAQRKVDLKSDIVITAA